MALTDAEFIFNQTSSERKRIGRGTYNKKRQGGRTVRFPSDGLSRKEKREMNGEVKTYSFYKPLKWEEFSKMPDDIKQEYLTLLESKFEGLPLTAIAESLGVTMNTMSPHMFNHKLKYRVGKPRMVKKSFLKTEDGKAWIKWHEDSAAVEGALAKEEEISEVKEAEAIENEADAENVVEVKIESEVEAENEVKAEDDIDKIVNLIRGLAGTGAKITIELNL